MDVFICGIKVLGDTRDSLAEDLRTCLLSEAEFCDLQVHLPPDTSTRTPSKDGFAFGRTTTWEAGERLTDYHNVLKSLKWEKARLRRTRSSRSEQSA